MNARQDLGNYTFVSKYARYLPDLKRRETFEEACRRVMTMHWKRYPQLEADILEEIEAALIEKKILGSQRSLQFAGSAIERINLRGYNCSSSHFDRVRFLAEAVWLLLCGCGVGFSVQKHHVAKLPPIMAPEWQAVTHTVEDSIEGWADAFQVLFESYTTPGAGEIHFDYSQVRPEGAALSTSSAKAPGPEPLRASLEACRNVLRSCDGRQMRPIDAYDLVMHAAMCVRAGGIRRSATIALFSPDDQEMIEAKTGEWYKDNSQRRLSNNSSVLVRKTCSRKQFDAVMGAAEQFGEPAPLFVNDREHSTNPCVEIGLYPVDDEGNSGWAFCNLTSVNVATCADEADFLNRCYLASVLGTLQAGYMDVGYLGQATVNIMKRDALIGVSLTGMADKPELAFNTELLRAGSDTVKVANRHYAEAIGIRHAARTTCVKPEGSGSLVLGVGNGIHPHHAKRYLRYVEGGKSYDPMVQFIRSKNPDAVVESAYDPTEVKIVFPIEIPGTPWVKADTTAVDHLHMVKSVQDSWVIPGTDRGNLSHNVSNTIQIASDEWGDVADTIWAGRESYGGVAMLGATGDLDYEQAPFVEVLSPEAIEATYGSDPVRKAKAEAAAALYEKLTSSWVPLDFTEFSEDQDNSAGVEVVACAGGACLI